MILSQRGMSGLGRLNRLGVWDWETGTYTDDDGSTFTIAETDEGLIAASSPATDLPVVNIPAGTTPPVMDFDPGKLIRAGAEVYKYVVKVNAQGKKTYVPQRYVTMQNQQPSWLIPAFLVGLAIILK